MKLPIDKKYLKISLYAVFTLILFYILKLVVDAAAFSLTNFEDMLEGFRNIAGRLVSIFSLPIIAFIIAYLLDPVCDFFQTMYEKKFKNKSGKRRAGVIITYLILILIIGFIILMTGMYIGKGMGEHIASASQQLRQMYNNVTAFLVKYDLYDTLESYIEVIWENIWTFFNNFGNSIIGSVAGIGSFVLDLILGFVIAFYFLMDKDRFLGLAKTIFKFILPKKVYSVLRNIAIDCDYVFSGYIRGQLTDAVIMSILISSFLTIFRIRFGIAIGIISGFSNIIPYFGAIVGFLLAIFSALLSGEPIKAVYGAVIMLVLQQVDSVVISPKVVGEKVALSPPVVIIALAIGGSLFGLFGMILAVPVCGLVKMIIIGRYNQYLERKKLTEESES